MHALYKISVFAALLLCGTSLCAQNYHRGGHRGDHRGEYKVENAEGSDVFIPISKYLVRGNAEYLSAWFDEVVEVSIDSRDISASRAQAKQIMKTFFESYTPSGFKINHTAVRSNMKYALGSLTAGGETFTVTIFISIKGEDYRIQQLKIERL